MKAPTSSHTQTSTVTSSDSERIVSRSVDVILLDLFSGMGGFSLGFHQAGLNVMAHYFSEIEVAPISVYRKQFKEAKYVGSVVNVQRIIKRIKQAQREHPTAKLVITFGSPCQDFSLAGKRRGLEGQRSGLIQAAIDIIKGLRPHFYIWENVKGAYSSNNGADYWAILQAFANIHGYRCEQQLLNTAWLIPQNRERIYLAGHFADQCTRTVFPFTEDDRVFDFAKRTGPRQPQTQLSTSVRPDMGAKADSTFVEVPAKAGCLSGGGHSGGLHSDMTVIKVKSATAQGYEEATQGDSINLSQPNSETRRGRVGKAKAQTLETSCNQAVITQRGRGFNNGGEHEVCPTISINSFEQNNHVNGIRRLTEIECERLQGFPDNWTAEGVRPKTAILKYLKRKKRIMHAELKGVYDLLTAYAYGYLPPAETYKVRATARYKMCGNAVTATWPQLIAQRKFNTKAQAA